MKRTVNVRKTLQRAIPRGVAAGAWHPARRLVLGSLLFFLVSLAAVFGYRLQGWTWLDSIYMVVITVFGIGYGEVHPPENAWQQSYTIGVIIFGYASMLYVVGGFIQMLIDGEVNHLLGVRRMTTKIERLHRHVIICGYGRMGRLLAERLKHRGMPLLIVDRDEARVQQAADAGHLVMQGNATEEELLLAAGVERASILATVLSDDVANLFITITSRQLNPKLQILARAEQPSTSTKLRAVGADQVILPAATGADRLAQMILRPSTEVMLRRAELPQALFDQLESLGLALDELQLHEGSRLCGKPLATLTSISSLTFLIVAVRKHDGRVIVHPPADTYLSEGDSVIIMGHQDDLTKLCAECALDRERVPAATMTVS